MSKFKISRGPLVHTTRASSNNIYPWDDMQEPSPDPETGEMLFDQFFVPGKTPRQMASLARSASKTRGWSFRVRAALGKDENGNEVKGVMVQRVEKRMIKPRTPAQILAAQRFAAAGRAARKAAK